MPEFYVGAAVIKDSTGNRSTLMLRKASDGTEQTGKVAADFSLKYYREGASALTSHAGVTVTNLNDAHVDWGIKELGDGLYRVDWPDAAFASGANLVQLWAVVTACFVFPQQVPLMQAIAATSDMAAAILVTPANKVATDASGYVTLGGSKYAKIVNVVSGSSTSSIICSDAWLDATANHYKGRILMGATGVLTDQICEITASSKSGNTTFTVQAIGGGAMTDAPASGDTMLLL